MRPQMPASWDAVKDDFQKNFPALDPKVMQAQYEQSRKLAVARRTIPAGDNASAPSLQSGHTAPPACGEYPTSCVSARLQFAQLVRCGR